MNRPLVAITPSTQKKGVEFSDQSISLSFCYPHAIEQAGGAPLVAPLTTDRTTLDRLLDSVDGLMLTGGGDVDPNCYGTNLPPCLKKTLGGVDARRDEMEIYLAREAHRRGIPVLGICRGHQVLNVALGGTLIADIPTQVGQAIHHSRLDRKNDAVHDVTIQPGTKLARIFGRRTLSVNSSHHQAVDQPGEGLRVSARSADGVIEGIETGDASFTIGVQFHPERMVENHPLIRKLFAAFVEKSRRTRFISVGSHARDLNVSKRKSKPNAASRSGGTTPPAVGGVENSSAPATPSTRSSKRSPPANASSSISRPTT